jgi:hypothetical protein
MIRRVVAYALTFALSVGLCVLGAWVGKLIDAFLTAQLGAVESDVTGWVVLVTGVAAWWANHVGTRRNP